MCDVFVRVNENVAHVYDFLIRTKKPAGQGGLSSAAPMAAGFSGLVEVLYDGKDHAALVNRHGIGLCSGVVAI